MLLASIDIDECIGCNRCVPVCPVDAIIGSPKTLHDVWEQACIGCKLCIDACPVDCITMRERESPLSRQEKRTLAVESKQRHLHRLTRLQQEYAQALPQYDNTAKDNIRAELANLIKHFPHNG